MKRLIAIFVVVVLSLVTILPTSAPEYEWPQPSYEKRMEIGAGWVSIPDVVGILVTGLSSIEFEEETFVTSLTPCTNPSFEMLWRTNKWFSCGVSCSIGYASGNIETVDGGLVKRTSCLYPTLGFVAETRYFAHDGYAMYGSWGAGVSFYFVGQELVKQSGDSTFEVAVLPCVDIYPLCVRWGDLIGFYAECGVGSKGILNVGAFIHF